MSWWSFIIIIGAVIYFIGKLVPKGKTRRSKSRPSASASTASVEQEAREIAAKVTTLAQARNFENRIEKASDQMANAKTEKGYENAGRRVEVLERARDIIESKTFAYQFIPGLDLDTPKNIVDAAYKVFSLTAYEEAKATLGDDPDEWFSMQVYDEPDESEPILSGLKKFRGIVESDMPDDEKAKKVNQLVKRDTELAEAFFDLEDDLSPWDQWQVELLHNAGAPMAGEMYREGYTKPEDYLKIDPEEFIKRSGVGPKRQKQLIQFQQSIKASSVSQPGSAPA